MPEMGVIVGLGTVAAAKAAVGGAAKTASAKLVADFYERFIQPKFDGISAQSAVLASLKRYIRRVEKSTKYDCNSGIAV